MFYHILYKNIFTLGFLLIHCCILFFSSVVKYVFYVYLIFYNDFPLNMFLYHWQIQDSFFYKIIFKIWFFFFYKNGVWAVSLNCCFLILVVFTIKWLSSMDSLYFSKIIDFFYADFVYWEVIVIKYNTHAKEF